MEDSARQEDERWASVTESLDLLFAKVGSIENRQQKIEAQLDMSISVLEQMLLDQQPLAKQMESTGNAVAQLTLDQMRYQQERPPSLASSDSTAKIVFQQRRHAAPADLGTGPSRANAPPHRPVQ